MMAPIQISHTGYWVYSMPHAGFLSILDGQAGYRAGGDASLPAFSIKVALGGYEVADEGCGGMAVSTSRVAVLDNERPASERRIIIINNVLSLVVTSLP